MKRVVITGIGAVTPVGRDAESSWESLKAGRSGIKRIDYYDVSTFPVQIAGICDDFELSQLPDPEAAPYLHRGERFGDRQRKAPGDGHLLVVSGGRVVARDGRCVV